MHIELPLIWIGFNLFVLAMLALELGVFHRTAHEVALKEAASLERGLDRPGAQLQPGHLPLAWAGGCAAVLHRLPDREGAQR